MDLKHIESVAPFAFRLFLPMRLFLVAWRATAREGANDMGGGCALLKIYIIGTWGGINAEGTNIEEKK